MGWKVKNGQSAKPYHMTDIAPTLAQMLKVENQSGNIGNPITEVLENNRFSSVRYYKIRKFSRFFCSKYEKRTARALLLRLLDSIILKLKIFYFFTGG